MKRTILAVILISSASIALAQSAPAPVQGAPLEVAATINGEVLTMERLDLLYSRLSPEMRANYDRAGGKRVFLNNYIEKRLLVQEALKDNLHRRRDIEADMRAAADSVLFDRYVREVVATDAVPESDIRALYETTKNNYRTVEKIHARHIIASPAGGSVLNSTGDNATSDEAALAKINRIAKEIGEGRISFADAAMQFSEDASAPKGGDLGWFNRGMMVGPFEEAAFALEPGKMSGVVKTDFGYHLILLEGRRPAGIAPFEEVRYQVREQILAERANQIMAGVTRLTQELRASSQINVNPALLAQE
ncbi:MAG TPA: peptidylprolyl isomerase [Thermoanaerobaculia bacterium]|nr:peptidylprolyl isomerase [Thermoanaerobaculia bacterium]